MTATATLRWPEGERVFEGEHANHAIILAMRGAYTKSVGYREGRIEIESEGEVVKVYDSALPSNRGPGFCYDCHTAAYWHRPDCAKLA